jgi:predicted ATPase/DNA-binding XRE family transcriptional regulator
MTGSRTFGSWLKQQRRALDLTQKELAQRAGCSTVTIHKIETSALRPSKDTAERLALCLEISPDARPGFVRFARGGPREQAMDGTSSSRDAAVRTSRSLPLPATQLIGREDDLVAIRKRLRAGARLLTLIGPPGVGKTRLALEAAYQVADEYSDGVFFVSLAAVADPSRVAKAIGQVLSVAEARAWSMTEQIKISLREKQVLLVLDNLEQVIEAAAFLADLLASCPWLTILVTSRQALRIHGERLYVVPALGVPTSEAGHALTAAEALRYPAVALFVERAEVAFPGFPFSDAAAETVAEICRRLNGLPLAIELVAAHADLFSPAELLQRWTGPWILASAGLRDAPARQQTLHDAIDWSYRLLDENEKSLLRRLAVFAGGADLAAIEVVCGCQSLDCLASLVDQSLIQRVTGPEAERRLFLLEVIREYALVRLAECGEEFGVRLSHAGYYQRLAAAARAGLGGPQQFVWFHLLERERGNLHAALAWALRQDPATEPETVELGLRLAADLYGFWWLQSHLREGLTWLERALDVAGRCDDAPALTDLMWKAGACAGYLGLGHKSLNYFDSCIETSRAILGRLANAMLRSPAAPLALRANTTRRALAHALELRSFFTAERNHLNDARADLDEAIAILREAGDDMDLAHALITYGHWAGRNGESAAARSALDESLELLKRAGNLHGSAMARGDLVRTYEYEGDFEAASRQWERESAPPSTTKDLGEAVRIHVVTWWLFYLAGSEGDEDRRLGVFRKAVAQQHTLGYRSFVDGSLYEPVYLALQAGMLMRAVRLAGATRVWLKQLGLTLDEPPQVAYALANVRLQLGDVVFDQAWAEGSDMSIPESAAYALSGEE